MTIRTIEAYLLNKKAVLLSVAIDTGNRNLSANEKILQNNKFNFNDMEFCCVSWNEYVHSLPNYIHVSNNSFYIRDAVSEYKRFAFSGILYIKSNIN